MLRRSAFDRSSARPAGFALRFVELAEQGPLELGLGLLPRADDRRERRVGLLQPALLHDEVLLVLGELLERLQVGQARAQLLVDQILANVDPLPDERARGFELLDRGGGGVALGLLLRPLAVERRRSWRDAPRPAWRGSPAAVCTCAGLAPAGG